MQSYLVFSAMGPDRPGLVEDIASFFTARGINIERSKMSVLGNEFGMIILTSGSTESIKYLVNSVSALEEKTGLEIHVRQTKAPTHKETTPSIPYKLIAYSIDHPGIVHQITKILKQKNINIEEMETQVDFNNVSETHIFSMRCQFSIPASIKINEVRNDLLKVCNELNIDIRFEPARLF